MKIFVTICCVLGIANALEIEKSTPKYHHEGVLPLASLLSHPEPLKKEICSLYNSELTQPKPNRASCHVQCDIKTSVKCSLNEFHIPECKDFAAFVFKKIFMNFTIIEKQKEFNCEIQTKDKHRGVSKNQQFKGDSKKSPLCDSYRKVTVKSAFDYPCYLKCLTSIVGVSTDFAKVDWELDCDIYEQTCSPSQATNPINMGFICESYRQFVLSKVKLGESKYHHCDVYNHGPQFDYFNYTKN